MKRKKKVKIKTPQERAREKYLESNCIVQKHISSNLADILENGQFGATIVESSREIASLLNDMGY